MFLKAISTILGHTVSIVDNELSVIEELPTYTNNSKISPSSVQVSINGNEEVNIELSSNNLNFTLESFSAVLDGCTTKVGYINGVIDVTYDDIKYRDVKIEGKISITHFGDFIEDAKITGNLSMKFSLDEEDSYRVENYNLDSDVNIKFDQELSSFEMSGKLYLNNQM
ncbi:hypothetical protein A0H76_2247 [Hepatospora eriocheir]|uniref:Uncharacterized protein n=1 Tax=Hepatospora eriocheir TaxID=1081669 RepID=A0A1X0QK29_9MICR|nr:hypothetical protein A0H76_2247 [Hepatospora eriocheir]